MTSPDAVVVGSGPNGLTAAATLAGEGFGVLVLEASDGIGGGARTLPLTLPGFRHDHCSAIHPLAVASPAFRALGLERHGVDWIHPPAVLAHPFDDGSAAVVLRSARDTGAALGRDGRAWVALLEPLARRFDDLVAEALGGLLRLPREPLLLARFGLSGLLPAASLARGRFGGPRARALFAGIAAHAMRPLEAAGSAAFGLVLGAAAHAGGWPFPRGGAQAIPDALAAALRARGGRIETSRRVSSLEEEPLRGAGAVLLDVVPRGVLALAGGRLPPRYARALGRWRHGPGVLKVDYALSAPLPWRARDAALAGTVHLGGTLEEIAAAEAAVARGVLPERPFVLVAQHTPFDPTRAPPGRHTAWAYAHVPNGYGDEARALAALEGQLERFAPGFREAVLARAVRGPAALEAENANLVGGDVGAGANSLAQTLFRPVASATPWATPVPGLYVCSAATPPGGGVHGLCGWHAARLASQRSKRHAQ